MSEFISELGPEFHVGGQRRLLAFQRVQNGPEEGGVGVSLYIDGEIHHSITIDEAGWESVLAHTCRAPHNGTTYAAAKAFHEAESHA